MLKKPQKDKKKTTKKKKPNQKRRKDHCLVDYQIDLDESTSDAVLFLCHPQTSL